jgi:hypothetical protein
VTARRCSAAAAALVAAGASLPAGAMSGNGSVDVGYTRSQTWFQNQYDSVAPLDYGAQLGLSDSVIAPALMQWLLSGSFRRQHTYLPGGSNDNNLVSFNGAASILSQSIFPLNLYASRGWSDFASDTTVHTTGSATATNFGGNLRLLLPDLPILRFALQRTLLDTTNLLGTEMTTQSTQLQAGLQHSAGRNSFSADYGTSWNSGNVGPSDFRGHNISATFATSLSDELRLTLLDRYSLRVPDQETATNPRWDDQTLSSTLDWRFSPSLQDRIDYRQQHQLFRADGAADSEITQYTLANTLRQAFSSELQAFLTFNGSYGIERLKDQEVRASSENGGGGVDWRRTRNELTLALSGSGTVGAVQQRDDGTRPAWTASGSAGFGWTEPAWNAQAGYSISYSRNGATLIGYSLSHRAYASVAGQPGASGILRGTLNGSIDVRNDQLLGSSSNRALALAANWSTRSLSINVEAGAAVGATNGVAPGVTLPDVPIAPITFNATQLHATLSIAHAYGRWRFSEILRTLTSEVPGLPNDTEHSAAVIASYVIGLTTFSVEDRFSLERTSGVQRKANYFAVRLIRSFGFGP